MAGVSIPVASTLLVCVRGKVFQPDWKVNQAPERRMFAGGKDSRPKAPTQVARGGTHTGQVEVGVGQRGIGATSEQGLRGAPGR